MRGLYGERDTYEENWPSPLFWSKQGPLRKGPKTAKPQIPKEQEGRMQQILEQEHTDRMNKQSCPTRFAYSRQKNEGPSKKTKL